MEGDYREIKEENGKIKRGNSKITENSKIVKEWKAECQTLEGENRELEGLCVRKEQELKKHKSHIRNLIMQLRLERNKYNSYHATTSTEIRNLQQQKEDCQTHIGTMSQIISKLSSRGLPEHRDDHYFMGKLDDLVDSISQWARLFSRGQQPLLMEDLQGMRKSDRVNDYISSSFLDFYSLVNAKNVGRKARTRAVEVIMVH